MAGLMGSVHASLVQPGDNFSCCLPNWVWSHRKSPFCPSLISYLSCAHFDSCVSHTNLTDVANQNLQEMLVPDIGFCLLVINETIISLCPCLQDQIAVLP